MARISSYDGEIGQGRQNDSSSSRESSPRRPQKRSFSPTSDDGDTEMPPMADDDTPPPPERPIIRQAVAFSATLQAPPSISTYQASLPAVATKNKYFLPGQEVPANLVKVMNPKPPKQRKTGGTAKRAKRADDFAGQTGRFRLQAYDPTPSFDPPMDHGQGPYSSLYRNNSVTPTQGSDSSTTMSTSTYGGSTKASSSQRPRKESSSTTSARTKSSTSKSKGSASKGKALQTNVAQHIPIMTGHGMPPVNLAEMTNSAFKAPSSSPTSPTSFGTTSYYRRDYEGGNKLEMRNGSTASSSPTVGQVRRASVQTQSLCSNANEKRQGTSIAGNISCPPAPYRADPANAPGKKPSRQPLRMVTILMQDIRSGETDHQLAEVKVSLRPAEDPQDGYWADAKELTEQLQAGPARIDGPAKVYTLRGKYRQFFLRVSADNVDEFISANVVVNLDRTLDAVIETLLPPGAPPPPPRIPRELLGTPSPTLEDTELNLQNSWGMKERGQERNDEKNRELSIRGRYSSPFDDYDGRPDYGGKSSQYASPSSRSRTHDSSRNVSMSPSITSTGRSSDPGALPPGKQPVQRGYDSPVEDDDPETVHELVSNATDTLLQKDSGWASYFRAKAAPQNCQQVLKQYEFIQRMMDTWVGDIAPFKSCRYEIDKSHIIRALRIDDEEGKYASNCTETLDLLTLYGKGGSRCENQRVLDLLNDQTRPTYNAKPIKRLLHLLREVDEQWLKDQPP